MNHLRRDGCKLSLLAKLLDEMVARHRWRWDELATNTSKQVHRRFFSSLDRTCWRYSGVGRREGCWTGDGSARGKGQPGWERVHAPEALHFFV